jgi:hypothetical protein
MVFSPLNKKMLSDEWTWMLEGAIILIFGAVIISIKLPECYVKDKFDFIGN